MLKCKNGEVRIKGSEADIRADFATIVHALKYSILPQFKFCPDPEEWIMETVRLGMMTNDEVDAECERSKDSLREHIAKIKGLLDAMGENIEEE